MHSFVSFNGEMLPNSAASLPAVSSAAFYGRGVFTTLAVYRGKPFLWELHEKRLRENATQIGVDLRDLNFDTLKNNLFELIKVNSLNNGRARITLFDSRSSPLWQSEITGKTDVLMTTAEERKTPEKGLTLTVSPFRINSVSPLTGVKSCNYLENVLALEAANKQNFGEAVRLNEHGEIVSATMANLFWTRDEQIFTPALKTGALAGTTRECLIGLAKILNIEVVETTALLKDLQTADEILLTSAGLGICPVQSLNSQRLSSKISAKIQMAFADLING
ncbi:MAG: aminotransferase class IV [Pyrinomonadaceae bacterium]